MLWGGGYDRKGARDFGPPSPYVGGRRCFLMRKLCGDWVVCGALWCVFVRLVLPPLPGYRPRLFAENVRAAKGTVAFSRIARETGGLQIFRVKAARVIRPCQWANVINALGTARASCADVQRAELMIRVGKVSLTESIPAGVIATLGRAAAPCVVGARGVCVFGGLMHGTVAGGGQLVTSGMRAEVFSSYRHWAFPPPDAACA